MNRVIISTFYIWQTPSRWLISLPFVVVLCSLSYLILCTCICAYKLKIIRSIYIWTSMERRFYQIDWFQDNFSKYTYAEKACISRLSSLLVVQVWFEFPAHHVKVCGERCASVHCAERQKGAKTRSSCLALVSLEKQSKYELICTTSISYFC